MTGISRNLSFFFALVLLNIPFSHVFAYPFLNGALNLSCGWAFEKQAFGYSPFFSLTRDYDDNNEQTDENDDQNDGGDGPVTPDEPLDPN